MTVRCKPGTVLAVVSTILLSIIVLLSLAAPLTTAKAQQQITAEQLANLQPVDPAQIPAHATFWEWFYGAGSSKPIPAPVPRNPYGPEVPVFYIDGHYFICNGPDDLNLFQQQPHPQVQRGPLQAMDDSGSASAQTLDTSGLYLQVANLSNGFVFANLYNATNQVYAIWSTTDLLAGWTLETELWPTNHAVTPFTVPTLTRQSLFIRAMDWTGVTENGNTVPDWWFWEYFGTTALSDTNLDGQGNTLLSDYQSGLDPNVICFSLSATNQYVPNANAPLQVNVSAGIPKAIATLVDSTNFAAATWSEYTSSNITINIGPASGWHNIWVGLRGLPPNATQTWQWKHMNLALPPVLTLTNPTTPVVDEPVIQLYGYCQEPLASISYDISNALGLVTNQPAEVTDQYYDSMAGGFTTNYFECLDVPLTNGLNIITIHASDLAGNNTATHYSFTLDFSSKTNPPAMQITWPQDGAQVSGTNVTIRGVLGDPTATVTMEIISTNSDTNMFWGGVLTNVYSGTVERNGNFWLPDIPIIQGTNVFPINVKDVVGNSTIQYIKIVGTPFTLTVNPVTPDSQLWQAVVDLSGKISDPSYAVWVNGVKGNNQGDGTWSATNVPVNNGGTALFTVTAYAPNEAQPDGTYGN